MKRLALDEIVGLDAYTGLRSAYRERVLAAKRARRMAVGDRVMLLFENRETVRFQVQEMLLVERIRAPEKVQHELDVYNELVPRDGELSATLMIEITEPGAIRSELDRLLGIDACVFLEVGPGDAALRLRARFDAAQLEEDRISAVHYLRFPLSAEAAQRLRDPAAPARIAIEHPHYRFAAALPAALRASLVADLDADPAPLLVPPAGASVVEASAGAAPTRARVRVRRAESPLGRGHVVVEPIAEVASWRDADAGLEAELFAELKRVAAEVQARFGACRVVCDLDARPWRWHVFAPESR